MRISIIIYKMPLHFGKHVLLNTLTPTHLGMIHQIT